MRTAELSVDALRSRWLPAKKRLRAAETHSGSSHPLALRIHRALSWLEAAERLNGTEPCEPQLIFNWIALNALYGRWDQPLGQPAPDTQTLPRFIDDAFRMDADGVLSACLVEHKRLALSLFENKFLYEYYWRRRQKNQSFSVAKNKFRAQQWYQSRAWPAIAGGLLECIYLVRCQLVHGAATYGGQLNRRTVRLCARMANLLTKSFLTVVIDQGMKCPVDWGDICYPPVRD